MSLYICKETKAQLIPAYVYCVYVDYVAILDIDGIFPYWIIGKTSLSVCLVYARIVWIWFSFVCDPAFVLLYTNLSLYVISL